MRTRHAATVLAATVLAAALTACGTDTSWVAKAGEDTMPAGVYILNEIDAYYNEQEKWVNTLGDSSIVTGDGAAKAKQFMRADVGGMTGSQKITEVVAKETSRFFATEMQFSALGLTFTEEEENAIVQNNNLMWQYNGSFYEQNGVSNSSVGLSTRNYMKRNAVMLQLYGENGERAMTDEAYESHFKETRRRIRFIPFSLADENNMPLTAEDTKALEDKVNSYLERVKAGEDISKLLLEYQLEVTGVEMPDATPGAYDSVVTKDSTSPAPELVAEMFDIPENEPHLVRTASNIFLAVRVDTMFNRDDFEKTKEAMLSEIKKDEFEAWLDEQAAAIEITYNNAALKRYPPEKLNFREPKSAN